MRELVKKIVAILISLILIVCAIGTILTGIVIKDFEYACGNGNVFSGIFSSIYGYSNRLFGKKIFIDGESVVMMTSDGNLVGKLEPYDPRENRQAIDGFNEYLKNLGIGYGFIITSECGDERSGLLPLGVTTNHCEDTTNKMISMLDDLGISYVNTYDYLSTDSRSYSNYFYKTDHHWNDYAGLYVSQLIAKYLNEEYDFGLDYSMFNLENYEIEKHDESFMGSYGRKVGYGTVYPEDFDILTPKFNTKFDIVFPKLEETNQSGSYRDALIYGKYIISSEKYVNRYCAYLGGDFQITNIHNLNVDNNIRVLVLKDSKANVVNAHLACAVEYLDIIDLRHYKDNLKDYIESTSPDVVLHIQSAFAGGAFYAFDK